MSTQQAKSIATVCQQDGNTHVFILLPIHQTETSSSEPHFIEHLLNRNSFLICEITRVSSSLFKLFKPSGHMHQVVRAVSYTWPATLLLQLLSNVFQIRKRTPPPCTQPLTLLSCRHTLMTWRLHPANIHPCVTAQWRYSCCVCNICTHLCCILIVCI